MLLHTHVKTPAGKNLCLLPLSGQYKKEQWYEKLKDAVEELGTAIVNAMLDEYGYEDGTQMFHVRSVIIRASHMVIMMCPDCQEAEFRFYTEEIIRESVCDLRPKSMETFTYDLGEH